MIFLLTGLTVSFFKCKYDFTDQNVMQSRDPMELNFEGLQMLNRNIPTNRSQRVDEKNRVICIVIIILTCRVMVIKMLKMAYYCYFLLIKAKN